MSEAKRDFYGDLVGPDRQPEQPQAASNEPLNARQWLIEWNNKRMLHPSQDSCIESLAKLLAAAYWRGHEDGIHDHE